MPQMKCERSDCTWKTVALLALSLRLTSLTYFCSGDSTNKPWSYCSHSQYRQLINYFNWNQTTSAPGWMFLGIALLHHCTSDTTKLTYIATTKQYWKTSHRRLKWSPSAWSQSNTCSWLTSLTRFSEATVPIRPFLASSHYWGCCLTLSLFLLLLSSADCILQSEIAVARHYPEDSTFQLVDMLSYLPAVAETRERRTSVITMVNMDDVHNINAARIIIGKVWGVRDGLAVSLYIYRRQFENDV